ncbi:MAG: AfsR/SARP family transcriptional regulator, partial [Planctomycetota bacterium]
MRLRLLGPIELDLREKASADAVLAQPKRLALLSYLALHRPHGLIRRDKLLALLWPERDADGARRALRQSVYFLRNHLGSEAVESTRNAVGLRAHALDVDVHAFEAAAESADFSAARRFWRGDLMDGFFVRGAGPYERWLDTERRSLHDLAWTTFRTGGTAARDADRPDEALAFALAAFSLRPLNEASAWTVIELHRELGDAAAARDVYEHFRVRRAEATLDPPSRDLRPTATRRDAGIDEHEAIPLMTNEPEEEEQAVRPDVPRGRWRPAAVAMGAAALLVLTLAPIPGPDLPASVEATEAGTPGLAVLPFENTSGTEEEAALTAGLHGQL